MPKSPIQMARHHASLADLLAQMQALAFLIPTGPALASAAALQGDLTGDIGDDIDDDIDGGFDNLPV